MKNKKLVVSISILCLLIVLYIGTFAYYRIVRNGNIQANMGTFSFNVSHNNETFASINLADTIESSLSSNGYISPGSSGKFDLLVDATGGMTDVEYTISFNRTNVPSNMNFYLNKEKTNKIDSSKTVGGYFDSDEAVRSRTYVIYWDWPFDSDNDEDSNFQNKNILLNVEVVGKQSAGRAIMLNGDAQEHSGVTAVGMWNEEYRSSIKSINFSNDLSILPETCNEANKCWNITDSKSKYPVYHYLKVNENDSTMYDAYIVSEKKIYAPVDCSGIFEISVSKEAYTYVSNVETINFNGNFDTSKVTNMYAMFATLRKIENIDLSNFDTSQVTNMSQLFYACTQLKNVDLSSFNTAKVTDMSYMFQTSGLVELDLTPLDTSNVTNMFQMFYNCSGLVELDLTPLDTSNVTNMSAMFSRCSALTSLDLTNFDTSNVTNMSAMFNGSSALTSLDLTNFDTSKVTDMKGMFGGTSESGTMGLREVKISDKFVTDSVTNMRLLFRLCAYLKFTINITGNNVTNYDRMFEDAATDSTALITLNYTTDTETLVDNMVATAGSGNHVVKGSQI
jgi:surface protein